MGIIRFIILLLLVSHGAAARAEGPFREAVLHGDGAWCWFQDERAIVSGRGLFVGSISGSGDVQVTRFDAKKKSSVTDVLHPAFEKDDHDSPALLENGDGEVMAFYSRHGTDNLMNQRTFSEGAWGEERAYTGGLGKGFTYANPVYKFLDQWLAKAVSEAEHGHEIMLLCPVRPHRVWWRAAERTTTKTCYLNPVKFVGEKSSLPLPLAMMYWGERGAQFQHIFESLKLGECL